MKKLILSSVFACFCLCSAAQKFEVGLSEPEKSSWPSRMIAVPDGGFVALKITYPHRQNRTWDQSRVAASLARYDQNMKLLKEVKLSGGELVYGGAYWDFRKIGSRYWFIYVDYTGGMRLGNVMAAEVNLSTLETGTPKILAEGSEIDLKLRFGMGTTSWGIFSKTSSNGEHTSLCIFVRRDDFYVCCLDENLDPEWKRRETEDLSKINIQSTEIDNAGNIYFSYMNETEGHIVACTKEKKPVNKVLQLRGEEPRNIQLLLNKKGDSVIIAGTYRSGRAFLTGIFTTSMSTGKFSIRHPSLTPLPNRIIDQIRDDGFLTEKINISNMNQTLDLTLRMMDDETIVMTGEFRKVVEGSKYYQLYFVSGSILSVFFDENQVSFARIPKLRVSSAYLTGDSYYAVPYHDQLVVFYNDYPDHLKKDILKSAGRADNFKNTALVAAVVDRNGSVQRQVVVDKSSEDYMGIPEDIQMPSAGIIEVPLVKMRAIKGPDDNMMWGKIEIKK